MDKYVCNSLPTYCYPIIYRILNFIKWPTFFVPLNSISIFVFVFLFFFLKNQIRFIFYWILEKSLHRLEFLPAIPVCCRPFKTFAFLTNAWATALHFTRQKWQFLSAWSKVLMSPSMTWPFWGKRLPSFLIDLVHFFNIILL